MKDIALHFKHEKYMNCDYEKFLQGNDKSEEDKDEGHQDLADAEQPKGEIKQQGVESKTPTTSSREKLTQANAF